MKKRQIATTLVAGLLAGDPADAQSFETLRVATGLTQPIFLASAPHDFRRVFVLERGGLVRLLRLAGFELEATPFLTISGIDAAGEGGLLGLAFHPDYATNGYFYVDYTVDGGTSALRTRIVRYQVSADPDIATAASAAPVLSFL